jgi:flagellar hook assembly protein FlgD
VLQHGDSKPGSITVTWDGRDATGTPLPDGVYFLRMTLEGKSALRRIVRLRTLD